MAFNSFNNQNGNQNKTPELTVYSSYRMNNAESEIDPTCLTFRFWKNNICIGIFPKKNTGNDEIQFDMDDGITIYLSHTKARILANEIRLFLKDPVTYNACGIPSGQAVITISNGSEYGKNAPTLTIRKLNNNNEVAASFAYQFKTDYHFAIRNYDGKNFDTVYDDYKNIEIEQMLTVLDEYCAAMTNAVAFSVLDQRKYSANRLENKIDAIASSLGVEIKSSSSNGQRRYNSSSHFANSSSSDSDVSYGSATIDDLE